MTIATLPLAALIPPSIAPNSAVTNITQTVTAAFTFDGAADRCAVIAQIPKTGTLTAFQFRTVIVSTAGGTLQGDLQSVNASGMPSGSLKYTNGTGTVVVSTADDQVWKSVPINGGTGVSVTKGDVVAFVLSVASGTPNTLQIAGANVAASMLIQNFPYLTEDPGTGTWAINSVSGGGGMCLALDYGGTLEPMIGGFAQHAGQLTTIGNGAERALRLSVPWPMRVVAARYRLCNIAAGGDFRLRIYDDSNTVIADSLDIDGDVKVSTTQDTYYDFEFPETVDFAANGVYYAAVWQKTANQVQTYEHLFNSATQMQGALCGAGFYSANRAAGGTGSWTETTNQRPDISLWVSGFDDGAGAGGGGGMLVHPGMGGRLAA